MSLLLGFVGYALLILQLHEVVKMVQRYGLFGVALYSWPISRRQLCQLLWVEDTINLTLLIGACWMVWNYSGI